MRKLIFAVTLAAASTTLAAQPRDSRGIPVMSEEANVPAGANQPIPPDATVAVSSSQTQVFQTRPATAAYPACARGQTDRCTQTYEGAPRRMRRRR